MKGIFELSFVSNVNMVASDLTIENKISSNTFLEIQSQRKKRPRIIFFLKRIPDFLYYLAWKMSKQAQRNVFFSPIIKFFH